jgi:hypothetical protein
VARQARSVFRASTTGAGKVAANFDRARRDLQDELIKELRHIGLLAQLEVQETVEDYGLIDTEQLLEAIRAVPYFRARRPQVTIQVDRLRGHGGVDHDYLNVTRFGHRRSVITPRHQSVNPKHAPALKVHVAGHRSPAVFEYRSSVRGVGHGGDYQPTDWTIDPDMRRRLDDIVDDSATRLGRRIDAKLLRP